MIQSIRRLYSLLNFALFGNGPMVIVLAYSRVSHWIKKSFFLFHSRSRYNGARWARRLFFTMCWYSLKYSRINRYYGSHVSRRKCWKFLKRTFANFVQKWRPWIGLTKVDIYPFRTSSITRLYFIRPSCFYITFPHFIKKVYLVFWLPTAWYLQCDAHSAKIFLIKWYVLDL